MLSAILGFIFQLFSPHFSAATVEIIGRQHILFNFLFWCFNKVFLFSITADFNWWNKPGFSCTVIRALSVYQMECLQGWLGNHSSDSPRKILTFLRYIPNIQNSLMPKFGTTTKKKQQTCSAIFLVSCYNLNSIHLSCPKPNSFLVYLKKIKWSTSRYYLILC